MFYGGLIVAVVVALWYIRRIGLPLWTTCDVFAPGIALGHVVGRLGCLFAGCCFGKPTDVPWAITFTDPFANANVGTPLNVPLHPTQLYEAGAEALILLLLLATESRGRRFPGRTFLFFAVLLRNMFPAVIFLVPLFILMRILGLVNTHGSLILTYLTFGLPLAIWLLKGFIDSVPSELDEAALIDGCSRLGAFYRVILPLMRPGLVAGAVLTIMMVWNDFIIGYSVTLTDPHRMVQVGLYLFITEFGISWGPLMAATMTALAPVVAAFAFMQRALIQGMTGGSVRG